MLTVNAFKVAASKDPALFLLHDNAACGGDPNESEDAEDRRGDESEPASKTNAGRNEQNGKAFTVASVSLVQSGGWDVHWGVSEKPEDAKGRRAT